jgi:hypothetical protein
MSVDIERKDRLLPGYEQEIEGMSIEEIRRVADGYIKKLSSTWYYVASGAMAYLLPTEYTNFMRAHAERLYYEADKRWALNVINDPHATQTDLERAKHISWNVRLNTLILGAIPQQGAMDAEAYQALCQKIVQKILGETPDEKGRIVPIESFYDMEDGDN